MLGATTKADRRGAGRRAATGWLLVVAVAVLLLALQAEPAHAAPPEVKASEKIPVVIPHGQTTKPITLTGYLAPGTQSLAKLVVTPTPVGYQAPTVGCPPCSGSVNNVMIAYGTTYYAELRDALTDVAVSAKLEIKTTRPKPTLTVRPAPPICVNEPGEKVQVGVAYNLDGQPTARLKVTGTTLDTDVSGSGSESFDAEYNHTYTARLLLPPANTMDLVDPVTITTKDCGDDPEDPSPCTETRDCPTLKWSVDPHGTYARFEVTPSAPVQLTIQASTSPPVNGVFASLDALALSSAVVSSTWTTDLVGNGLKAATHYYCLITGIDQANNVAVEECEFTTLTRSVTVSFNSLTIHEDSDDSGAGELTFEFSINGNQVHDFSGSWETEGFCGCVVTLNAQFAVVPSDPTLTLSVFGWDDDEDPWDSCAGWELFSHPPYGSDECAAWNTVEETFTFPTGEFEELTQLTTISRYQNLPNLWAPNFEVSVDIAVTYN